MLTNWISPQRIVIQGAERLYPKGLHWVLSPGINAVVGGTGLGKTTLFYAFQFAVFGKMVINSDERIERDFFKGRLTKRLGESLEQNPPSIQVDFNVGDSKFVVTRNLITGAIKKAVCDGNELRSNQYESALSSRVGLAGDFQAVVRLQCNLFFFGESRNLLAWNNQLQHELINLMMSNHESYLQLGKLWDAAESADSRARNLSAQAVRMEKDKNEMIAAGSNVKKLEFRVESERLDEKQKLLQRRLNSLREEVALAEEREENLTRQTNDMYSDFHQKLSRFEEE